ncbi:MAG: VCBS repeat-containing protein [Planctomycetaceae bacterium]|nr:VCBS repeat-containing protein [Planctomycetaceae bacterium]
MSEFPFSNFLRISPSRVKRRRQNNPAFQLEVLENRILLTLFTVDTLFDTPDAMVGDGIPEDSMGRKTLRAAIQEAEANPGPDSISIIVGGTIERTGSLITITDDLTITALGPDMLTYDANSLEKHFHVFSSKLEITGMTLTGGLAGPFGGGAMAIFGADVTLDKVAIIGNASSQGGAGGISFGADFTNGDSPGSLIITDSLIANNLGPTGGITIGNGAGDALIVNSTISNNTASTDGGGIHYFQNDSSLVLRNVTITDNKIDSDGITQIGAGIYVQASPTSGDPVPVLHNTIVAGNIRGATFTVPNDIDGQGGPSSGFIDSSSSFNLIGDATTSAGLVDGVNSNFVGDKGSGTIDIATVLDTTLADNGGPTDTHALVIGSLAANGGSDALAIGPMGGPLLFDQRGVGFDRIRNGTVDIGAYESPFDGGGRVTEDLIVYDVASGRWKSGVSDGDSFSWTNGPNFSTSLTWQTFTGDFNGDGFLDGIGFNSSNKVFLALNDGMGGLTTVSAGGFSPTATFQNVMVGDYDGNGTTDLLAQLSSGEWFSRRFNGATFETAFFGKFTPSGWSTFQTGDFNGDGVDDIIGLRDSMDGTKANFIYGISNEIPMIGRRFAGLFAGAFGASVASAGWTNVVVGDWNADGKDDVIAKHGGGQIWYATSNGTPITMPDLGASRLSLSPGAFFSSSTFTGEFQVGDFDGNGLDDLVTHNPSSAPGFAGVLRVGLTTLTIGGTPTMTSESWGLWGTTIDWGAEIVGDFNGDGFDDLAGLDVGRQLAFVSISSGSSFALSGFGPITGVDDILGDNTAGSGEVG